MVPEGRGVFTRMTITENLQMGAYVRNDKAEIAADIEQACSRIFPRLKERRDQLAGTLSRRRAADAGDGPRADGAAEAAAAGRAVDGPVADHGRQDLRGRARHPRSRASTILLVEQNASRALRLANRGYVMESGEVTMSGDAKALLNDPKVRAAYLGE